MKNLVKSLVAVFGFGAFFASCDTDPCKNVDCGTQGTCTEGLCVCATGYEKDSAGKCEVKWSTKFLGQYNVSDTCHGTNPGTYLYVSTATEGSATQVAMSNFGGFNNPVNGTLTGSFDMEINNFTDAGNRVFNGTGALAGNILTVNYIVTYSDNTKDTCVATFTKQ